MITFIYVDKESTEHVLEMPDPEWITDYTKIHNVTVRRAMSGKLRTYVVRDRKYSHAITYSMNFTLHRADVKRFNKFLALCDGHYIWTKGTDSNVSAQIAENAPLGSRDIKLRDVTGSINVGDYAQIGSVGYYTIIGVSSSGMTVSPGLDGTADEGGSVDVFKQQMVIITNQQFDFGSQARAAGDENDPDNSGTLIDKEDETYSLTLSILVIKT